MSDLDVLIIGGYSLTDRSGGGTETRDKIWLNYKNIPVTIDFINFLIQNQGNLDLTLKQYIETNKAKMINRSLNVIYLFDFLSKNRIKSDVVNYFLLEQNKFMELMQHRPKVIVISTTFISDINEINNVAKEVKKISPKSIVIVGGIKILKSIRKHSLFNQNYFDGFDTEQIKSNNFFFEPELDKYIDIFVIEECGEITLVELIRKILNNQDFKSTPNIAFQKNNEIVFTNRVKEPYSFEKNLISWDKIPTDIIGNEIPVMAGMGCPFKCAFCDFTGLHKVKIRTIDNLIQELKLIEKYHPGKPIFFTDDNLFATKKRTKELSEAIVANGLKFKWRAFFRVDAISEDNVDILAKSGCMAAFLGVESGDDQILQTMNKKTTREQALKSINLLNKRGINTLSTIIIGFPGETKDSVNNTIDLLNNYPDMDGIINQYYPFSFILFPLSPVASPENRKKHGMKGGYENWSHNTMNSDQAKQELIRLFKEVNGPFLLYPEYIGRSLELPKLKSLFKEREKLVKNGTNNLNDKNVNIIFDIFRKILN